MNSVLAALGVLLLFMAAPIVAATPESTEVRLAEGGRRGRDGGGRPVPNPRVKDPSAAQRPARERVARGEGEPKPMSPPVAPAAGPAANPPANPPADAAAAAAANDAEVAAARERVEKLQALSEEHHQAMVQAGEEFQSKMQTATSPEQRRALQLEFQQLQRTKLEEFQRRSAELTGR